MKCAYKCGVLEGMGGTMTEATALLIEKPNLVGVELLSELGRRLTKKPLPECPTTLLLPEESR